MCAFLSTVSIKRGICVTCMHAFCALCTSKCKFHISTFRSGQPLSAVDNRFKWAQEQSTIIDHSQSQVVSPKKLFRFYFLRKKCIRDKRWSYCDCTWDHPECEKAMPVKHLPLSKNRLLRHCSFRAETVTAHYSSCYTIKKTSKLTTWCPKTSVSNPATAVWWQRNQYWARLFFFLAPQHHYSSTVW